MAVRQIAPTVGVKPDWVAMLVPVTLATHTILPAKASVLLLACLVAVAVLRPASARYIIQPGPFLLLVASFAIVFTRPHDNYYSPVVFCLVSALVYRLITTVDARVLITSLVDGWGLFLLVNVLAYESGIGLLADAQSRGREATGFVRITFPLTSGWNAPAILAGAYLVALIFLIRETGWIKRSFRIACAISAMVIFVGTGSRGALVVTILLAAIALQAPNSGRWIAQATFSLAAFSAWILPVSASMFAILTKPLAALTPGRVTNQEAVTTLQGRSVIWDRSIQYWGAWVNDPWNMWFGFGSNGQYQSGASSSYRAIVAGLREDFRLVTVHNTYLQQLFDGGLIGFVLLALVGIWTGTRLSKRLDQWGRWDLSAIFALTALGMGTMTEATMAPGVFQESFWMFIFLTGIACQTAKAGFAEPDETVPSRDHLYPAAHR